MAHVAKYTCAAAGHMCAHYDRQADNISNPNIDPERTPENYNLAPEREAGQIAFINQRKSEVRCLKRDDVNVMCSWVVTAPQDFPESDEKKFFRAAYDFMAERYGGEQNVVSAHVHMDEKTPHMHFAFVPVVEDAKRGDLKISAKEAINKQDLQTFHKDLSRHMEQPFGRDVGILNDATREGNRSIEELKRGTAVAEAAKLRVEAAKLEKGVESLQRQENVLCAKIRGLEGQVLTVKGLDAIKPEKTVTGAVKGITVEQVQDLKKTAMQYHAAKEDVKKLKQENNQLRDTLNKEIASRPKPLSMEQKIKNAADHAEVKEKARAFDSLPGEIQHQGRLNIQKMPSVRGLEH